MDKIIYTLAADCSLSGLDNDSPNASFNTSILSCSQLVKSYASCFHISLRGTLSILPTIWMIPAMIKVLVMW